jgi:large subunit ribosomal protein L25
MEFMKKEEIKASHRSVIGKQVGALRRQGKLPGVIYGHQMQPTPILMDLKEATHVLSSITGSSLLNIDLEGKNLSVLVREKQRDFIRNILTHIDFQAVSLTEKLRTKVSVELTGLSPAVKDFNGYVITNMNELEVECLPQDLPERIIIDISVLMKIGDVVLVSSVVISDKVTILSNPEEAIVVVTANKEEVEEVVEVPVVEEPEVIERGRKEEEEAA